MTKYIPKHSDGRTGPAFDSATFAALWIICTQDNLNGWEWES